MVRYVTGYVVMPEHVHLLISEPERSKSVAIQMLKQITSQKLHGKHLRRFWQVRYYDFPVWSEAKRIEKLRLKLDHRTQFGLGQKRGCFILVAPLRQRGRQPMSHFAQLRGIGQPPKAALTVRRLRHD